MIPAILWKEYREQRASWLVFAVLVTGLVFGLPPLFDESLEAGARGREPLAAIAILLAGAYGLVCGSLLLANEREEGTLGFLDQMPVSRLSLWGAKVFAGLLLTAAQVAFILSLVLWRGLTHPLQPALGVGLIPVAGLGGLMWGTCCSARAKTVLGAIVEAISVQVLVLPVLYLVSLFVLAILVPTASGGIIPVLASIPPLVFWLFAPLPVSAIIWTENDQRRSPPVEVNRPEPAPSWGALFWLAWRQMRGLILGLVLFAIPAGFLCRTVGPVFWPVCTLIVGVVCGVALFLGERGGPHRFLAEQRYPLGCVWWSRVIVGGLAAMIACAGMVVPTLLAAAYAHNADAAREVWERFGTRLLGESVPIASYLLLWVTTGFATGAVCGLLFHKPIVAVFLSVPIAALLCVVWLPALVLGGVMIWQTLAPALVLLVLSRRLMHPWATDQLGSGPALRLIGAGALAIALMIAGGLAWRVYGLADVPEPAGLEKFLAGLPEGKENEGGELVRRGLQRLDEKLRSLPKERPGGEPMEYYAMLWEVCRGEQAADDPVLSEWLDKALAGDWQQPLSEAVKKPEGMLHDPRRFTFMARYPFDGAENYAPLILLTSGLRAQKTTGDAAAFVRHLDMVLTTARAHQAGGLGHDVTTAMYSEGAACSALDVWLAALGNDAALLRRAQEALSRHVVPESDEVVKFTTYLCARNTLHLPHEYLSPHFSAQWPPVIVQEAAFAAAALQVPWEKVRQRRLLRLAHFGGPAMMPSLHPNEVRVAIPLERGCSLGGKLPKRRLVDFHAARLLVALRLYLADKGKPADRLEQLVPDYLDRVPNDPFSTGALRYRLSKGEEIAWPGRDDRADVPMYRVAAGQGVIWSAGEDGRDDGGTRRCAGGTVRCRVGEDVIFPVPLPRK